MSSSEWGYPRLASARSWLFAPANDARKVSRLDSFSSDAVVLDLEDAVAESERPAARKNLATVMPAHSEAVRCIRINVWTGDGPQDLAALPLELIDAVMLPKVETATELDQLDQALTALEAAAGLPQNKIAVIALIETPRGMLAMSQICAGLPARVARFAFGSGDYTAEMGVPWTPNSPATQTARDLLAMHSQAAALPPPVDGPYLDIHDLDGLRQDTVDSLARGFTGRVVVYPKQVAVVQDVYGGILDDVEDARGLVDAFEAAVKEGLASLQYNGKFVDYAVYRDVKRRLEREQS